MSSLFLEFYAIKFYIFLENDELVCSNISASCFFSSYLFSNYSTSDANFELFDLSFRH
jgi:hypothetical protein